MEIDPIEALYKSSIEECIARMQVAVRLYMSLRRELFNQLIALKELSSGQWKITYTRDPRNGDARVPPLMRHEFIVAVQFEGIPFENATGHSTIPDTHAPLYSLHIKDPEGNRASPGSNAGALELRFIHLLTHLLENVKVMLAGAARLERDLPALAGIDLSSLAKLQLRLPSFPYWPRIKGMNAEKYEAILAEERPLTEAVELTLHKISLELSRTRGGKVMRFQVALSFPGEKREFVKQVADHLSTVLGRDSVLYDEYLTAELARPDMDLYLTNLYRENSELLVPFYCTDYERKEWCRLEWRQMRDILKRMQGERIMPFRFDDAEISGVLSIDGYVKIVDKSPKEVAGLILQRLLQINLKFSSKLVRSTGPGPAVSNQVHPGIIELIDQLLGILEDAPKNATGPTLFPMTLVQSMSEAAKAEGLPEFIALQTIDTVEKSTQLLTLFPPDGEVTVTVIHTHTKGPPTADGYAALNVVEFPWNRSERENAMFVLNQWRRRVSK